MKNRSVSIAALAFIILAALFVLAVMVRDYQIRVRDKRHSNQEKQCGRIEPFRKRVPGTEAPLRPVLSQLHSGAGGRWTEDVFGIAEAGRDRASDGWISTVEDRPAVQRVARIPARAHGHFAFAVTINILRGDPRRPLVNNAISAEFPPGSTFKLSTATGAFNEGVVKPGDIIQTPGKLVLCERFSPNDPCTERNSRPFVDWIYDRGGVINEAGFGSLDFFHCIAYSSNVCFYKLGGGYKDEIKEGLGIFRLGQYARALGYGEKSGIELPGEENGLVPTPQWKRINQGENWSTGDTYIASVGQGLVTATPLQVLMSGATIANRGKLMQPTVIREVQDSEGGVIPAWFDPNNFEVYEQRQVVDKNGRTQNVWVTPTKPDTMLAAPPEGSYQISPFTPNLKWDVTVDPKIKIYNCDVGYCDPTGQFKVIQPATIDAVRTGTRLAVVEDPLGTLHKVFTKDFPFSIAVAGKTGTAEYCDDVARKANRCNYGLWPTHAWTLAYAPFDDPEIIILAFAYNGGEGGSVAAPIVARVMQAYFELKSVDLAQNGGG